MLCWHDGCADGNEGREVAARKTGVKDKDKQGSRQGVEIVNGCGRHLRKLLQTNGERVKIAAVRNGASGRVVKIVYKCMRGRFDGRREMKANVTKTLSLTTSRLRKDRLVCREGLLDILAFISLRPSKRPHILLYTFDVPTSYFVAAVYNQRESTSTSLTLNTIHCSLSSNHVSCPVDRYA
jgi:hypothetical protein